MNPRVDIYVETIPNNWERAVGLVTGVEYDGENISVYLTRERALLALALVADILDADVVYEGEKIEVDV